MSVREAIIQPARLFSRSEVLGRPGPIPPSPGVYGWYFDDAIPGVPTSGTLEAYGRRLFYAGISPKAPPKNGKPPSKQNIRQRVRYHMKGNAEGSTLRLTLGCLLAQSLGIELRRIGSGRRMTFGAEGEAILDDWLDAHASVVWAVDATPWVAESEFIHELSLPLNLQQNRDHPFHATLTAVRRAAKARARELPILAR